MKLITSRVSRAAPVGAVGVVLVVLVGGCSSGNGQSSPKSESELRKKYPEPIDLANARAKCLATKGWDVQVNADGSIESSFPSNQGADYDRDDLLCQRQVGIDPDAPTPKELVKQEYKKYVKGAACLREKGWSIAPTPTFQTFMDTYETDPWIPWDSVPDADAQLAEKSCPVPEATY